MKKRKLINVFVAPLPHGTEHEYTMFAVYEGGVMYYYAPAAQAWTPVNNVLPPAEITT